MANKHPLCIEQGMCVCVCVCVCKRVYANVLGYLQIVMPEKYDQCMRMKIYNCISKNNTIMFFLIFLHKYIWVLPKFVSLCTSYDVVM